MAGGLDVVQQPGDNKSSGKPAKRPADGFAIDSQRREYKLMEVTTRADGSLPLRGGDVDSDEEGVLEALRPSPGGKLMVVKSKHGKTRPVSQAGAFSDRPVPKGLPPGAPRPPPASPPPKDQPRKPLPADRRSKVHPEGVQQGGAVVPQMPFVYASEEAGLVLTRGQYLELSEARSKAKAREAQRAADAAKAKEVEDMWMCDPRMLPGWTVHFSKAHGKCYFVNAETKETVWRPPGKYPERPVTPPPVVLPPKVDPAWLQFLKAGTGLCCRVADSVLPAPPRWWIATKRQMRLGFDSMGCGECCGALPVPFEGPAAQEALEIVEALGLSQGDVHALREGFQDADYDGGGQLTTEEVFAWLDNEPITPFSRSIFKLADMDDSGLLDFCEFVKVVCAYSSFNEDDVLKFGFDIFDTDGGGTIDEYEMKRLVEQVNGGGGDAEDTPNNGNLQEAIRKIDEDGDGLLDFGEFTKLCRQLPLVLYPAFRLQKVIQRKTLGQGRWDFLLWNVAREKRVAEYMRTHHGRKPAGEYKAPPRVLLESLCPALIWSKLPVTYPDFLDGIRPAAGMREGVGTYGDGYEHSAKPDTSKFTSPSF